tara:strand:- start:855 stop:1424 length:570 start_codon:yes stop_codon:yes gene_type:complete
MLSHSRLYPWARRGAALLIPLAMISTALPAARAETKVNLEVDQQGNTRTASMTVPVPPQRAWEVLTDYVTTGEAMPDISNVQLLSRQGNNVRLRQTYQAPYTFGLTISAVLGVAETPKTAIHFRLLKGDLISALSGSWTLTPTQTGTRLHHTITLVPELPDLMQPLFAQLTRTSLRESMLRLSALMEKP